MIITRELSYNHDKRVIASSIFVGSKIGTKRCCPVVGAGGTSVFLYICLNNNLRFSFD
jgi:hypothetical protein